MKTIEDVASFIEEHDWIKRQYKDGKGGYCISGAIMAVCSNPEGFQDYETYISIYKEISKKVEAYNGHRMPVATWNDFHAKDKDDVLRMLRS